MIKKYINFKDKINEHALYFNDLSRFDNYLDDIKDDKITLKNLLDEMNKFKELILEFNHRSIFKIKLIEDDDHLIGTIKYNNRIESIINKLVELLDIIENVKIQNEAFRIVYGSEDEMDFHPEIQIDKKFFNRIHIISELPYSLRNIGLGKILYKNIIEKVGWLSSNYDSSINSKFVWDSLSKDEELYTCLKDQSIICFDSKLDINIIENIVRKWLNDSKDYVIDSDMMKKYPDFTIK